MASSTSLIFIVSLLNKTSYKSGQISVSILARLLAMMSLAQGYDFVLVARVRTAFVSMQQVLEALRRACEKLGLLR